MRFFKTEDQKMFDSLQNMLNKLKIIESKPIQIVISDRVMAHYSYSLEKIKDMSHSESNSLLIELVYEFDKKTNELHKNDNLSEIDFFKLVEFHILRALYICLSGCSNQNKIKAVNYFMDFITVLQVDKYYYLKEIDEINKIF